MSLQLGLNVCVDVSMDMCVDARIGMCIDMRGTGPRTRFRLGLHTNGFGLCLWTCFFDGANVGRIVGLFVGGVVGVVVGVTDGCIVG